MGAGGRKPAGRTRAALAVARVSWIDRRARPVHRLGCELGDGNAVVVRVAQVVGPVHVGAAVGFGDQMHGCGGAVAELCKVESLKNVERADQHNAAGRWRRSADDGVVVEAAGDGSALDHGVLSQVVQSEQRASLVQFIDKLARDGAVVETVGIGRDALQA